MKYVIIKILAILLSAVGITSAVLGFTVLKEYILFQCILGAVLFTAGVVIIVLAIKKEDSQDNNDLQKTQAVSTQVDKSKNAYIENLANNGDASAQVWLGRNYVYGNNGYDKDWEKAYLYLKSSAEQGNADGQAMFAIISCNEKFTHKNYQNAFCYAKKSAEQNYGLGQCVLAYCYQHGIGVKQDKELAKFWYRKARDNGFKEAEKFLTNL